MPKLNPPSKLRALSSNVLVKFYAEFCIYLIIDKKLEKLGQVIGIIKEEIRTSIPSEDFAIFAQCFVGLLDALWEVRNLMDDQTSYGKMIMEVLMDKPIDKLSLSYEITILNCIDSSDARRFQGLKKLDLTDLPEIEGPTISIADFCLKDLTHFVSQLNCTNYELKIIAKSCPKLKIIELRSSNGITDKGLWNLLACKELRCVDVADCELVTHVGVLGLLMAHDKIYDISCSAIFSDIKLFECSKLPQLPSVKRLAIRETCAFNDDHLEFIVSKFPNLTYLYISGHFSAELLPLTRLSGLKEIQIACHFCTHNGYLQTSLNELLKVIGYNLSSLHLFRENDISNCQLQDDLNFIFQYCKNLQNLHFHWRSSETIKQLFIPPFSKLRSLCCTEIDSDEISHIELKFEQMLRLESLSVGGYKISFSHLKSIVNDNVKFPLLKMIEIEHISEETIMKIDQIAHDNNLDIHIHSFQLR